LTGHHLVRINLSEHSEIADLLGSDLPSADPSGSNTPKFVWCDGIFLTAMKRGDWVLLDELNLAPQSVLEGLNACLDHRGEVYLPEIGQTVKCSPSFRVFCAQNPVIEGGGRKGLPQSFLSRFSKVFVESMTEDDMRHIAISNFAKHIDSIPIPLKMNFKAYARDAVANMVKFVNQLHALSVDKQQQFARDGSPWEFNLRDVLRWAEFIRVKLSAIMQFPGDLLSLLNSLICEGAHVLFIGRLRNNADRTRAKLLFKDIFKYLLNADLHPPVYRAKDVLIVGVEKVSITHTLVIELASLISISPSLYGGFNKHLESIAVCMNHCWPVLLIGSLGRGKRLCVRHLRHQVGAELVEFSASTSTDSTELLGSFEQINSYRYLHQVTEQLDAIMRITELPVLSESSVSREIHTQIVDARQQVEVVVKTDSLKLPEGKHLFEVFHKLQEFVLSAVEILEIDELVYQQLINAVAAMRASASKCYQVTFETLHSGFEWVDGIVVSAMKKGRWLLFNNVNLCSASVLDRLNSVLEPNGSLLLTENGVGEVVYAHPNFRIFFTMVRPCYLRMFYYDRFSHLFA
jgi:midasin